MIDHSLFCGSSSCDNEVAHKGLTDLAGDHRYDYLTSHRHTWSPMQWKPVGLVLICAVTFLNYVNICAVHVFNFFVVSFFALVTLPGIRRKIHLINGRRVKIN